MKVTFGKLYTSYSVKEITDKKDVPSDFMSDLNQVRRIIRKEKLHKLKYTDIFLGYDEKTFLGTISSKKQGVPNNPYGVCKISNKKEDIENFSAWAKEWDYNYSPKGLKAFKDLQNKLMNDKNFISAMKKIIKM